MSSLHGFGLATAILAASGAVAIASWGYISARRRKSSDPSIKPVKLEDKEEFGSVPTQEIGPVPNKDADNGEDTPVHVVDKEHLSALPAQVVGKVGDAGFIPVQMVEKQELCFEPAQDAVIRPDRDIKPVQIMVREQMCPIPGQDGDKRADVKPVQEVNKEELVVMQDQDAGKGVDLANKSVEVKEELGSIPLPAQDNSQVVADVGIKPVQVLNKEEFVMQNAGKGVDLANKSEEVKEKMGSIPALDGSKVADVGIKPVQVLNKEEFVVMQDQDAGKGVELANKSEEAKEKLGSIPAQDGSKVADVGIKPVQVLNEKEIFIMQGQDVGKDLASKSVLVEHKEVLDSIVPQDGGKREDTCMSMAYEDHMNTNKDLKKVQQAEHETTPVVSTLLYMEGKAINTGRTPLEKEVNTCTAETQTTGKSSQVLVLGLDGSGKTSVLNSIAANKGKLITTPTEGVNAMCVSNGSSKMEFLEIGGSEQLRPYWKMYLARAFAVIFVVDSADHSRLPLAKRHLHQLIQQDSVLPLIVLANKQDLRNAHHITDIHDALALSEICENRKLFLIGTHVTKEGEDISSGIQDAKEFLNSLLK